MKPLPALLGLALTALVLAAPAAAKEGVKATLTKPVPLHAPAGSRLTITWTLTYRDDHGRRRFFGAGEVFVRLLSGTGARSTVAFVNGDGHYRARVRVPSGGIGGIRIGLRGYNDYGVADMYFPITNNPFRRK